MTPAEVMGTLDALARELDSLSSALAQVERDLEPVARDYEAFLSAHEIGLWQRHIDDGVKFPPERLRERLAIANMPPELFGRFTALVASRKRIEKRLGALKAAVDAQRSILSALKTEMEAGGGTMRRAA